MKTRKLTSLVAMFAFLCAIIILPAKIVKAEVAINIGQQVSVPAHTSEDYKIGLSKGSVVYLQGTVTKKTDTSKKYGYTTVSYTEDMDSLYLDEDGGSWDDTKYTPGKTHYLGNKLYYIRENGVYTVHAYNSKNVAVSFAVVDGTQILSKSVSKPHTVGNNYYTFKPLLSGLYSFTVKSASNKQIANADVSVFSYNGVKEITKNQNNDRSVVVTESYDSQTFTCTLQAGVTYYIYARAYEAVPYVDSYGDPDNDVTDTGYTLSITQSPSVKVSKVTISKATSPKAKTAKVTWKKAKSVSGYEVSYSTKKNMKGAKTVFVSKKAVAKTIKKLKAKKTYYVRVRAYKTVEGNKYFGAYSKKLKVKTK